MGALDEAKKKWGSAEVISGGNEPAAPIDYSNWAEKFLDRTDERLTGIAEPHFSVFAGVARGLNCVIVVRQTKAACLPWIKLDFPAKPSSIWKIKNSAHTGLVTCSAPHPTHYHDQQLHAWKAGHYVLQTDDEFKLPWTTGVPRGRKVRALYARRFEEVLHHPFYGKPFEPGQVIDPESLLPLTGDYDLMGAFPAPSPKSKALTKVHDADAQPKDVEIVGDTTLLKQRENPYVLKVAETLNEGFSGRPRIMHGSHDLKFDPTENNKDGCSVFTPELAFWISTAKNVEKFYSDIGRLAVLPGPERAGKRG